LTIQAASTSEELFSELLRFGSRADPYPIYNRLSHEPIGARTSDGAYLITSYEHIAQLLRDPRLSAVNRWPDSANRGKRTGPDGRRLREGILRLDPPDHDEVRLQIVHQLLPRVLSLGPRVHAMVDALLDEHISTGPGEIDIVADLAYALPVSVICELLDVPASDEPVFQEFARVLTRGLDPGEALSESELTELQSTRAEFGAYIFKLIQQRIANPGEDLISGLMAGDDGVPPLETADLIVNLGILLIAGHETTVNLIANGILALLRHPEILERLRYEPELAPYVVEEVLRYDPPVQFMGRSTLADIRLGEIVIPRQSHVTLVLAAGNRDPLRFADPDLFLPGRADNTHLSFGSGIHYCVGAALARTEAICAFNAIAHRLVSPRLVQDPPHYRANAVLRGPECLPVAFAQLGPASATGSDGVA
jgi:cytochrome P450